MQVILMEKVANLGELGDVVKVKDGYARNFLIPHGKAKRATEVNLKAFESRRADLEKAQAETLAKARERGAKLDAVTLQVVQKAGPDGRLFGSVTNYDIVEGLKALGHEVERAGIRMPQGPLKQVGDFPIQIQLHTDVIVTITVSVLGEKTNTPATA
ncbi:MAG TPA: 50S ribosomal protein L9 [Burkholderiales bacterium]